MSIEDTLVHFRVWGANITKGTTIQCVLIIVIILVCMCTFE